MSVEKTLKCRICHSENLEMFLDLGKQPLADAFLTEEQLSYPEAVYPLEVYFCHDCTLVQLGHVVAPEVLYHDDYPYETGVNEEGVRHFRRLAKEVIDKFDLKYGDLVIDIGSNDGTLLAEFQELDMEVVGIEPVRGLVLDAKVMTLNMFFGSKECIEYFEKMKVKAKVITATNVVAHIDDLHGFVENVKAILADDGIFIMEVPHLDDMLEKVTFDQIYHEHLSYFSAYPLQKLFKMHDMVIINAEWQEIHGGSMRYYVGKMPQKSYLLSIGDKTTIQMLNGFAEKVQDFREKFLKRLQQIKMKVIGVSAPAKGNTLLNYLGKEAKYAIGFITERSEKKIGKYTPGLHIKIFPDEAILNSQPDYVVILAHNWAVPIAKKLINMGYEGEFIIPNEYEQKNFNSWLNGFSRERDSQRATA